MNLLDTNVILFTEFPPFVIALPSLIPPGYVLESTEILLIDIGKKLASLTIDIFDKLKISINFYNKIIDKYIRARQELGYIGRIWIIIPDSWNINQNIRLCKFFLINSSMN